MASLSMNEVTTYRWSFEEDVVNYAAAGISAIGIWRHKLSDFGEAKARDLLAQHALEAAHLFWAGGFTGSDGRSFRESVVDAAEAVRTAGRLGADSLIVCSGARAGHTHSHARRLIREALKELLPLAEEHQVVLALEPMHPGCAEECTFLTSIDDALEICDTLASPYVRIVLDTYHLGHDPDIVARAAQLVDRLALVQLGDARHPPEGEQSRCLLGEGMVPIQEIVAALLEAGYDGYLDVELLGEEIETTDYADLLEHAKTKFAEFTRQRG